MYLFLFQWQTYNREGKTESRLGFLSTSSFPKILQWLQLGPEAQTHRASFPAFPGHEQGAGFEVEQLRLKLALIWDAHAVSRALIGYVLCQGSFC